MAQYKIFEGNMPLLEKKLQTVANKCARLGCSFRFEQVGEEYETITDPDTGMNHIRRFVLVEAEGKAVLNGWRFVASLEHTEHGNIIHAVDGAPDVPSRFYTCKPYCEHCRTSRERKASYIVQEESTGEFKQVGGNCLRDFTGGMSAEGIAWWLSLYDALKEAEQVPERLGRRCAEYFEVEEMLTYFIEAVNHFGYVRTSEPYSTLDRGCFFYRFDHGTLREPYGGWSGTDREMLDMARDGKFTADRPENHETAQECIEWGKALQGDTNYAQNLRTICANKYTERHNLGLIASVLPSMNRELERQAERRERERKAQEEAKVSDYVGEVGKRISAGVADARLLTSWETQWGTTYLYKFVDEQGNVLVWKSSKRITDDVNSITGTVKEHAEYNGVKQTVLTRCKTA